MNNIAVFVLDEADVMIDTQGFRDQSIRIHRQCPRRCQFPLFSATYDEAVMKFAQQIVQDPNLIRVHIISDQIVSDDLTIQCFVSYSFLSFSFSLQWFSVTATNQLQL